MPKKTEEQLYSLLEKYQDILPEKHIEEIIVQYRKTGDVDFSKAKNYLSESKNIEEDKFSGSSIKSLLLTAVVIGGIVWALVLAFNKHKTSVIDRDTQQMGHFHQEK